MFENAAAENFLSENHKKSLRGNEIIQKSVINSKSINDIEFMFLKMNNTIKIIFLFLAVFCCKANIWAAKIEGSEPGYAGRSIEFVKWSDPVSKTEKAVFTLQIDEQGKISHNFDVSETIFCYADFDIYRCKLMLSPGQSIRIKLPPPREKSFEESKNPYFKPVEMWMMAHPLNEGEEELTSLTARFDQHFDKLKQQYFNQLFHQRQRKYIDTVKIQLDAKFPDSRLPLFNYHKKLQLKTLEADMTFSGREKLLSGAQNLPPEVWNLPSFVDVIDRLFSNTFSNESKGGSGGSLRAWIAQTRGAELKKWVETYTGTLAPLSDLLLLKMLHDAFYSGEFDKNAIIRITGDRFFTENASKPVVNAAKAVNEKISFLHKNTKAPEICLKTIEHKTVCSSASEKPFQYIMFADLDIPVCQEQVKYLKTIYEKLSNKVDFYIVVIPPLRVDAAAFLKENDIPGTIVFDTENREISRLYRIRSFPTAFLLDNEQKVILAPAKTPLDGFEHQFAGVRTQ